MSAGELVETVMRMGGVLELDGRKLKCKLPTCASNFVDVLRERRPEIMDVLKAHGGRIAAFPRCPRCASYALYRRHNIGSYECLTCGLLDIYEAVARRMQ